MSGRDKGKAKSLPTDSGHRHPHNRGVTISSRKARELLFRSTQSSSGAETEEVPEIPPLSVALPTPIMDIEAWRPRSPWRGNPMAGNDKEAGTYYDSQPEHSSTDAEEGRPSRGCKSRTSSGCFARSSHGASCNAERSESSRPGKRKGTEEDTSWRALDQTNAMQPDWLPYGICPVSAYPRSTYYGWLRYLDIVEPYMPDRTLRQLGFIQEVPHHILEPESCYRFSAGDRYRVDFSFIAQRQTWDLFPRASKLMLGGLHKAPLPSMATDSYLQCYDAYSHRFIINPTELPDGGAGSHYVEGLVPDQVRKLADAPQENGHLPYQNGVHNANNNNNANANDNGNVVFHHNDAAENGEAGNVGGNNNGNGGSIGGGRDADGNVIDWLNTITIWRYDVNNFLIETIQMALYADQFDSWDAFADAIYHCWLQRNANTNTNANGNAGVIANGHAGVIANGNAGVIANGHAGVTANGNAGVTANGNANANALEARVTNPGNCWPGSTTLFGRYDGHFTNLDWPVHDWETVRGQMNCVRLFENNAQHDNYYAIIV
ncbi:hypothetical protein BVRB_2g045170 [Beta vulgaris subsp. vulgaris]|uniref:Aminotransferase-like plant mobile domain-containing protein n=1 Tax=Beta vulgaris subsp. vulgaris TaxID=3555 RepID=A0A0J8BDH2_BETVV|nr:hypothetical protein BVRB_2g045170 [Beta vulgaris subsp. vulgaris]